PFLGCVETRRDAFPWPCTRPFTCWPPKPTAFGHALCSCNNGGHNGQIQKRLTAAERGTLPHRRRHRDDTYLPGRCGASLLRSFWSVRREARARNPSRLLSKACGDRPPKRTGLHTGKPHLARQSRLGGTPRLHAAGTGSAKSKGNRAASGVAPGVRDGGQP